MPRKALIRQGPKARLSAHMDLNSSSDCGDKLDAQRGRTVLIHRGVKHKQPYCHSLILTSLIPFFSHCYSTTFIHLQLSVRYREETLA